MPALRGGSKCFAHDEERATARAEARQRAAAATNARRPPRPATAAPESATPLTIEEFELGKLDRHAEVAPALLRLAKAIAAGEIDPRRGRLLTESLRAAEAAFLNAPDVSPTGVPLGAREATAAELRHMIEHRGKLPPGVEFFEDPGTIYVYDHEPGWHGPGQ